MPIYWNTPEISFLLPAPRCTSMIFRPTFAVVLSVALPLLPVHAEEASPGEFVCHFASTAIAIDGQADEEAWSEAQTIDRFYLPWLKEQARPARTATQISVRESLAYQ